MQKDDRSVEIDSLKFQLQHYEKMLSEAFDNNEELLVTKPMFQEIRRIKSLLEVLSKQQKNVTTGK